MTDRPRETGGAGPSLLWLITVGVRRYGTVAGVALAITVGVALVTAVRREHTATAMFVPDAPAARQPGLGALAQQFGLGGLVAMDGDPPEFYVSVLSADDFLAQLAQREYRNVSVAGGTPDTVRVSPLQLYGGNSGRQEQRLQAAVEALRARMSAKVDLRSRVTTLKVTARWPWLAEQLSRNALELLNDFNLSKRRSRATAERRFAEARVEEARRKLAEAENDLVSFLRGNRTYRDSPVLSAEAARLQRRVDLEQQTYVTLAQALEQARIDEVRNTPVITVVDGPEGSARPSQSVMVNTVLGLILGLGAGLAAALLTEFLQQHRRSHTEAYADLERAVRSAMPGARRRALNPEVGGTGPLT